MPVKQNVYNQKAEQIGELKLSDKIFSVLVKDNLIHQAMLAQSGNERQVLAHTKDRSEVRGGGRKPWRQKGTGRARAGSTRSPIWIGGGVTFGPRKTRNFKKDINKKMRQKAIFMALSDKISNNSFVVLEELKIKEFKTKDFDKILTRLEKKVLNKVLRNKNKKKIVKRSILVINDKKNEKIKYSSRNLIGIKVINLENINLLDLLKYRNLVITKKAIKNIEKKYKI